MTVKTNVLWIEDTALQDLSALSAPVRMDGRFKLDQAESATEGLSRLREQEYDVVIVDIRLPPGEDPGWIQLHRKRRARGVAARLGLELLYVMLRNAAAAPEVRRGGEGLRWLTASSIGVLTVESQRELATDMTTLGIGVYKQKSASLDEYALLILIEEILARKKGRADEVKEP